jgi:hypothetical protein
MKTKRQEELINTYLSALGDDFREPYREIALYLSKLGYNPKKEGGNISFKHDQHNKQMAKMGFRNNKLRPPFFALRFSDTARIKSSKSFTQSFRILRIGSTPRLKLSIVLEYPRPVFST